MATLALGLVCKVTDSVADLRSVWMLKRPFAPGHLRDSRRRTIRRINQHLEKNGLPIIEDLGNRLFVIADGDGEIASHFGLRDPNRQLTGLVFDRDGRLRGRFDPESDLESLAQALSASLAR